MASISSLLPGGRGRGLPCQGLERRRRKRRRLFIGICVQLQRQRQRDPARRGNLALECASMAEFEVQRGEVFFGNVHDGFPAMESILYQHLMVLRQPQASQHLCQIWHGRAGRSSDRHDVGGMRGGGRRVVCRVLGGVEGGWRGEGMGNI